METSHPPIPFDPQGLVALEFLSIHGGALQWLLTLSIVAVGLKWQVHV
jgi:hypothetical protein